MKLGASLILGGWCLAIPLGFAQGTAFTYQGRLDAGGSPATGNYEMLIYLCSTPATGGQLANQGFVNVPVSNGLFTVLLNFGDYFDGSARWLEIALKTNGAANFSTLTPRQPLTPTPYAITASNLTGTLPAGQLTGVLPSDQLSGTYAGAVTFNNTANSFSGDGTGLANVNAASLGGLSSAGFWRTNGNLGANPANGAFLGTADNLPLELRVNNQRGFRLETGGGNSINVIGGWVGNSIAAGVIGATVSGGGGVFGGFSHSNRVESYFGTVAGGAGHWVGPNATYGAIAGGDSQQVHSLGGFVGGGRGNSIFESAPFAAISGGRFNAIYDSANHSFIGGGELNAIWNNADHATIAGGINNLIGSLAEYAVIGGGNGNRILNNAVFAVISGGSGNQVHPSDWASIGGGFANIVRTNARAGAIGGGEQNIIQTNAEHATIPGGYLNSAAGRLSLAAGNRAKANHAGTFVWADSTAADFASSASNQFLIRASGGVGVGTGNPQGSLHVYSQNNPTIVRVQSTGTPGFGRLEFVSNPQGDVNEWRPGYIQSTDNGGFTGGLAFFVNGTGAGDKFGGIETMRVVNGAVGIGTAAPVSALQVVGTVTATAFNPPSDRNLKENFTPVNSREVLDKVAALPISRWNFKGDESTPHVGPMAQDFHAAFGLGTDDKHIATVDADGVALAAIQGLNQKVDSEAAALRAENAELKAQLAELRKLIGQFVNVQNAK